MPELGMLARPNRPNCEIGSGYIGMLELISGQVAMSRQNDQNCPTPDPPAPACACLHPPLTGGPSERSLGRSSCSANRFACERTALPFTCKTCVHLQPLLTDGSENIPPFTCEVYVCSQPYLTGGPREGLLVRTSSQAPMAWHME